MVDTLVLGTSAARRGGSSPLIRTKDSADPDFDKDNTVNVFDLSILLSNYGK